MPLRRHLIAALATLGAAVALPVPPAARPPSRGWRPWSATAPPIA